MYNPDRVMRQFGLKQRIPPLTNTSKELHKIDLRGKTDKDWSAEHSDYVSMWTERASNIANDELLEEPMGFYDPYMVWYRRITRRFMSSRGAIVEALAHGITSIHQLTLGDDVSIPRIRDMAASTLTTIHADYRIYNMPPFLEEFPQSSHENICSNHGTPVYTPYVPLNNESDTTSTPPAPPNTEFETTQAFHFDRILTLPRHFDTSPIPMNSFETTSSIGGKRHDINEIQQEDAQNLLPTDVDLRNVPLASDRKRRIKKRTRCGTGSHFLGSD
ncbi:hypothetical protein Sjap_013822 [Stephania japonica]|uniref:Aminotransferase-like plant mobile domain-containing protein n=1 Tax=Stephania japonica TaxID=461633 RepID=A0AAP0IZF0_9MAGN